MNIPHFQTYFCYIGSNSVIWKHLHAAPSISTAAYGGHCQHMKCSMLMGITVSMCKKTLLYKKRKKG